jgi:hypothetical protein
VAGAIVPTFHGCRATPLVVDDDMVCGATIRWSATTGATPRVAIQPSDEQNESRLRLAFTRRANVCSSLSVSIFEVNIYPKFDVP